MHVVTTSVGAWALLLALLALGFASSSAYAAEEGGDGFFEGKADGYYWYEDPPPIKEDEEKEKEEVPAAEDTAGGDGEDGGPAPLSAEWLRTTMPKLRDAAIDNPTQENVRAYFYAQRIMMDKAQVFSDVAKAVVESDPLLDENLRLPFAAAAKVSVLQSAEAAKEEILKSLKEKVALWVFYDETCVYCEQQIPSINRFAEEHGLKIEIIHKQGGAIGALKPGIPIRTANGQFESIGINFTPSVVMVHPPSDLWVISQGFTSYTALVDRVVAAANRFGLVPDELYREAAPMNSGVLRADRVEDQSVDWQEPEEWVPFIRSAIGSTYGLELEEQSGEDNEKVTD